MNRSAIFFVGLAASVTVGGVAFAQDKKSGGGRRGTGELRGVAEGMAGPMAMIQAACGTRR